EAVGEGTATATLLALPDKPNGPISTNAVGKAWDGRIAYNVKTTTTYFGIGSKTTTSVEYGKPFEGDKSGTEIVSKGGLANLGRSGMGVVKAPIKAAIETVKIGADVVNTTIQAASLVTDNLWDTGVYQFELKSDLLKNAEIANRMGKGNEYAQN